MLFLGTVYLCPQLTYEKYYEFFAGLRFYKRAEQLFAPTAPFSFNSPLLPQVPDGVCFWAEFSQYVRYSLRSCWFVPSSTRQQSLPLVTVFKHIFLLVSKDISLYYVV